MTDAPTPDAKPRRRGLPLALIVVASVLAFTAILAVWVNRQVLNTDNWTAASSQMLEQPPVRDQLAAFLVDRIYANVDVEAEIREVLPPRAEPLAGPAAAALRDLTLRRATEALANPGTQELWEDANRLAHQALLRVIDGDTESVELDLKALLERTQERAGVGGRAAAALPDDAATIPIVQAEQLDGLQAVGNVLKGLPILLVGLSLALFGAALAVGPQWRRQAVRTYGAGLVVAGAGALVAVSLAGDAIVGALAQTAATEPAIRDVWAISTTLLDEAATATIGYGLLMVLGAWLVGPSTWAVTVRRTAAPVLRDPALAWGAFAALAAIVVLWWSPTPATRNPVTALLLVALLALGFEALRRKTAGEVPAGDPEAEPQSRLDELHDAGAEPPAPLLR